MYVYIFCIHTHTQEKGGSKVIYILYTHTHTREGREQSSRSVLGATRTGGITGAREDFSTQDLAAVLKAAFPKIKAMLDLARSVKKVDSKAFAHVHLTDNGRKLAKDDLPKIVKSICSSTPAQVYDAKSLLKWLVKVTLLSTFVTAFVTVETRTRRASR